MSAAQKKLGIAFGGGGVRGMAHVGLIEELDKHGIRADMVAGTSIGSLVAALYACGYKGSFLARLMENINLKQLLDIKPSFDGLMTGSNYAEFARLMTKTRNIEDLPMPLRIVATDLNNSEMKVFDNGPIWRAVHASSAIPGVFVPVEYRGETYVDGCLVDNCPCAVLRDMGADVIIAVDLDTVQNREAAPPTNLVNILQRSVDVMGKKNSSAHMADICLTPMTEYITSVDVNRADFALECGRTEAAARIDEILELLR